MTSETRVDNLKWTLENWREIVVLADRVLSWEQDWFAGIVAGAVSFIYLLVWYWDPTMLTLFAFTGLFISLADYLGPKIIAKVFGPDNWNGAKEKHFELVCEKLCSAAGTVESWLKTIHGIRGSKPVAHFVATLLILFSIASIGSRINNFFLAYLSTLLLALMPGLLDRKLIQKSFATVMLKVEEVWKSRTAVPMKKVE